jgi:hypothetical protein
LGSIHSREQLQTWKSTEESRSLIWYKYVCVRYFHFIVWNFVEVNLSGFCTTFFKCRPAQIDHHFCDTTCALQSNLKWNKHIDQTASKANKILSCVRRNLKVDSSSIKNHAYQTLVRPKLEYCSSVWDPYTAENNYKLEKVSFSLKDLILSLFATVLGSSFQSGIVLQKKEYLKLSFLQGSCLNVGEPLDMSVIATITQVVSQKWWTIWAGLHLSCSKSVLVFALLLCWEGYICWGERLFIANKITTLHSNSSLHYVHSLLEVIRVHMDILYYYNSIFN